MCKVRQREQPGPQRLQRASSGTTGMVVVTVAGGGGGEGRAAAEVVLGQAMYWVRMVPRLGRAGSTVALEVLGWCRLGR